VAKAFAEAEIPAPQVPVAAITLSRGRIDGMSRRKFAFPLPRLLPHRLTIGQLVNRTLDTPHKKVGDSPTSRAAPHHSGSLRLAEPSAHETCIHYPLPV
jgi:hypothetical protein